jgi:hypothetical protein
MSRPDAPHAERRAFLAALIAEATNIGLGRMSEVCNVASRRTLTTISIWHMREETYRAALARIIEALHREPAAAWFGTGQVSSSDGQHFYLDGEGGTGGKPRVEILVRGDSHYCAPEVLDFCRANRLDYILGVAPTSTLRRHIEGLEAATKTQYETTPGNGADW